MDSSEPVAWAVTIPLAYGGVAVDEVFFVEGKAKEAKEWRDANTTYGAKIVPLYEKPQPSLTQAELEAIEKAISRELDADWYGGPEPARVVALRGLLARTTL